ncbi:MAG TPA: septum formation initiator family protein [Terriglobales bacterium]|jgi:cell division protein FtsB|nr:septum formation initiator family protein [Terriglobales bacterium]
MDIRIKSFPKVRVLFKRERRIALVAQPAAHAEAVAERVIEKFRPAAGWLYGLRRRFATGLVGLLTVWLFVHVMFGANGMIVYRAKRTEVLSLQKEIDSLQKENSSYNKQIDDLKTNPKTIEKAAREQLHYARPGEVVYITPAPPVQETPRTDSAEK